MAKEGKGVQTTTRPLMTPKGQVKLSEVQGRGVFATQNIKAGEVIEECHCIFINNDGSPPLKYYLFAWDEMTDALPLGYGAIYNHADNPNCIYEPDTDNQLLRFIAQENIAMNQEIFIYYNDQWFEANRVDKREPWSRASLLRTVNDNLPLLGYSAGLLVVLFFLVFY